MKTRIIAGGLILASLILGGCATSQVVEQHHLYALSSDEYAQVVFFRPMPRRTRGVADNDVSIDVDKQEMLKLSAGEYAVVRLKPKDVEIKMRNMTYLTYKVMPEEVYRARKFAIEANKTYFIRAQLKVEEYRGYYFVPLEEDEDKGLEIIKHLKPATPPLS